MRLIDAEELHNALRKQRRWIVKREGFTNEGYSYDQVHFAIDNAPTVDAVPVRHGHWIGDVCSECGKDALCDCDKYEIYGTIHSDYCPHCGAKMDERGEDVEKID